MSPTLPTSAAIATARRWRAHHLVGLVTVNIDRDDDGPGLGEGAGGCRANTLAGTRHHGNAILEQH